MYKYLVSIALILSCSILPTLAMQETKKILATAEESKEVKAEQAATAQSARMRDASGKIVHTSTTDGLPMPLKAKILNPWYNHKAWIQESFEHEVIPHDTQKCDRWSRYRHYSAYLKFSDTLSMRSYDLGSKTTADSYAVIPAHIELWNTTDTKTPKLVSTIMSYGKSISSLLKISETILAFTSDKHIILYDISNPQKPTELCHQSEHPDQIEVLVKLSASSIASISHNHIYVWDISDIKKPTITVKFINDAKHNSWLFDSFIEDNNKTTYKTHTVNMNALNELYNLSYTNTRRLQALLQALIKRRSSKSRTKQRDAIQLTGYLITWFNAMPPAIQATLKANFNIAVVQQKS